MIAYVHMFYNCDNVTQNTPSIRIYQNHYEQIILHARATIHKTSFLFPEFYFCAMQTIYKTAPIHWLFTGGLNP